MNQMLDCYFTDSKQEFTKLKEKSIAEISRFKKRLPIYAGLGVGIISSLFCFHIHHVEVVLH